MGEQRRYFPEWTELRVDRCPELEADHNSYFAGGYAEEFGYRAQPGCSRGVPVLDGESPEACAERQGQAQATHPGYPIRPRPLDLSDFRTTARVVLHREDGRSMEQRRGAEPHGVFVPVSQRPYQQLRDDPARRGTAISQRVVAALIYLRWILVRRG